MSRIRFLAMSAFAAAVFAFACLASAQEVSGDPPDRVARLAYSTGDVEIAPAGQDDWGNADVNRPLITGDRLLTGDDGRAVLELGSAALRIDHGSAFNFLQLDNNTAQVELSQGTLNLRVRDTGNGQTYEVDTPTVAFIASQPGAYRVDIAPDGHGAMVTVFDGSGTVYGANGASRPVSAGQSYRFDDSSLANVAVTGVPSPDDFDRFCETRDNRWQNSVSRNYVSPDVIGYDDLDQYGSWQDSSDYGSVWYPTQVSVGWAPYRYGHWVWVDPWGWTWVDDAPWGFAPFHYGRWVFVGNRWGWCPGPRYVRPVYAPALVAFVGGSGFSLSINLGGGPIGWFPLGPRDIYVPPYRASRNYFNNVNITNIRNVYVNKTVINNYYGNYVAGRPMNEASYVYRGNPHAFTAVPRNVFTTAKPVNTAVLHVPPREIAQAKVMTMPHVAPTQASLAIRPPVRPIATPARAFNRTVVAKTAPPPRPVPFAARERIIDKQNGAPIPVAQLHQMREQQARTQPQPRRVQVVAAKPATNTELPAMKRGGAQAPGMARQPAVQPRGEARITPIQAPVHPVAGSAPTLPHVTPLRPGELPSARFAHPDRNGNMHGTTGQQPGAQAATMQQRQAQQRPPQEQQQAQPHANTVQPSRLQQQQTQQQDRMRTQQEQQRSQMQAQQQQDRMRTQQEQQRSQMQAQQAEQARKQQQAQQQQAQQRQYEQQMRAQQQEQQRAEQAQMQQAQQRQYQQQMRAQQQEQQADQARMQQQYAHQAQMQQQHPQSGQNAPPPPPKDHKHNNQQDDNGHR